MPATFVSAITVKLCLNVDDLQVATYVHEYPFKTAPARDQDAFGVEQFGRLVLIEKEKLGQAVQAMEAACQ